MLDAFLCIALGWVASSEPKLLGQRRALELRGRHTTWKWINVHAIGVFHALAYRILAQASSETLWDKGPLGLSEFLGLI
jgi:hypothetical protein